MKRTEEELEKNINVLQKIIETNGSKNQEKLQASRELEDKKAELEKIIEYKTKGAILRTKCRWHDEGEKNTKYFLNLEKRHCRKGVISQLKLRENVFVTKDKEILSECENFYKNLYKSTIDTRHLQTDSNFFGDLKVKTLDPDEKAKSEGLLTRPECLESLKSMAPDKSPGTNGIPAEFYKVFWQDIADDLLDTINYGFETRTTVSDTTEKNNQINT